MYESELKVSVSRTTVKFGMNGRSIKTRTISVVRSGVKCVLFDKGVRFVEVKCVLFDKGVRFVEEKSR